MLILQTIMLILLILNTILILKSSKLKNKQIEVLTYMEDFCPKCQRTPKHLKEYLENLEIKEGFLALLSYIVCIGMIVTFILMVKNGYIIP